MKVRDIFVDHPVYYWCL